jgi:uncharacterized protein
MECAALTGISPDLIRELKKGRARTLELQSAHNVVTLGGVTPGNPVFLTSTDMEDLGAGDQGIVVEVMSLSISMKRIVEFSSGWVFEERERMSARVKVKHCCASAVKAVIREGMFTPVTVDVVKCCAYHAG